MALPTKKRPRGREKILCGCRNALPFNGRLPISLGKSGTLSPPPKPLMRAPFQAQKREAMKAIVCAAPFFFAFKRFEKCFSRDPLRSRAAICFGANPSLSGKTRGQISGGRCCRAAGEIKGAGNGRGGAWPAGRGFQANFRLHPAREIKLVGQERFRSRGKNSGEAGSPKAQSK